MSPTIKGVLYSLGCSAAVGIHVVFSKLALADTPPATCIAYLIGLGAVFSIMSSAYRYRVPRISRSTWANVIMHSLLAMMGVVFTWLGLNLLNATVASFVARTEVLISIGLAMIFLGESLTFKRVIGFTLGMSGVLIMSWPGQTIDGWRNTGFLFMLLAALGFGACEVFGKQATASLPIPVFMVMRNTLIAVVLWAYVLISPDPVRVSSQSLLYLVMSAFFGPFAARYLFMHSLRFMPLSVTVGLNQTQPVFAAVFGVAAGLALPTTQQWLGGTIIIIGCLWLVSAPKATVTAKEIVPG